jgi:hypothetical protein
MTKAHRHSHRTEALQPTEQTPRPAPASEPIPAPASVREPVSWRWRVVLRVWLLAVLILILYEVVALISLTFGGKAAQPNPSPREVHPVPGQESRQPLPRGLGRDVEPA